jgi:predicted aspartyl protease
MNPRFVGCEKNGVQRVGRISIDFEVANSLDVLEARAKKLAPNKVRRLVIEGLVDPGATRLVLPESIAEQLGLVVTGKTKVRYADGRRGSRPEAEGAYVTILGRSGHFTAILEKKRTTALIGAIVLEDLDLLVDCRRLKLIPRDPGGVVSEIE